VTLADGSAFTARCRPRSRHQCRRLTARRHSRPGAPTGDRA
jgi:hypothetical protein